MTTMQKRKISRWLWIAVIAIGALVGLHYLVAGLPKTPMSVSRADRMFREGVWPGQSQSEVEAWLASQGIPRQHEMYTDNVCYNVVHRPEEVVFKGLWMDCRGSQTMAECAGLDVDTVFSFICVTYPDAARLLLGYTEVRVYLFFDEQNRLIRHWVDEFHISL